MYQDVQLSHSIEKKCVGRWCKKVVDPLVLTGAARHVTHPFLMEFTGAICEPGESIGG